MIQMINIHKSFSNLHVLRGVNLLVHDGVSMVVMGPSGCGKSVLLKTIIGLLPPDQGKVLVNNYDLSEIKMSKLSSIRRLFGFVFQGAALFDSMSVFDNVALPLNEHQRWSQQQITERVLHCLEVVGLKDAALKLPSELSGGMRKRTAIARAIVMKPAYILYDEPTTGLDPTSADAIHRLIRQLQDSLEVTSITVTHDLESAHKIGDIWALLHEGKIVFQGSPDQAMLADSAEMRAFLHGHSFQEG